jgi:hypothetical protein
VIFVLKMPQLTAVFADRGWIIALVSIFILSTAKDFLTMTNDQSDYQQDRSTSLRKEEPSERVVANYFQHPQLKFLYWYAGVTCFD